MVFNDTFKPLKFQLLFCFILFMIEIHCSSLISQLLCNYDCKNFYGTEPKSCNLGQGDQMIEKIHPNFGKISQNSCQAKKYLNIYITKVPKHSYQTTFETNFT
jgi:hypothetical protein